MRVICKHLLLASDACIHRKGELEVTGDRREKCHRDRREKCHSFLIVRSPVVHFGIKLKQLYQTYVLHVPIYSSHHLSPEQRISQIIVKTRLVFLLRGINGIRKTVKEMGFFGYEEMEGSEKSKILIDDVQNMASAKER